MPNRVFDGSCRDGRVADVSDDGEHVVVAPGLVLGEVEDSDTRATVEQRPDDAASDAVRAAGHESRPAAELTPD